MPSIEMLISKIKEIKHIEQRIAIKNNKINQFNLKWQIISENTNTFISWYEHMNDLFYIVSVVGADDMVTQGARASTSMMLTYWPS